MCIAIVKPEGISITDEALLNSHQNNSDGSGYAIAIDGEIQISKGFFEEEEFISSYRAANPNDEFSALLHCRIATHGKTNEANCHPFIIGNSAMIHNGIINSFPRKTDYSDTWMLAWHLRNILKLSPNFMDDEAFYNFLQDMIGRGNKLAFLHPNGEHNIVNEISGDWDSGVWYSNFTYSFGFHSKFQSRRYHWQSAHPKYEVNRPKSILVSRFETPFALTDEDTSEINQTYMSPIKDCDLHNDIIPNDARFFVDVGGAGYVFVFFDEETNPIIGYIDSPEYNSSFYKHIKDIPTDVQDIPEMATFWNIPKKEKSVVHYFDVELEQIEARCKCSAEEANAVLGWDIHNALVSHPMYKETTNEGVIYYGTGTIPICFVHDDPACDMVIYNTNGGIQLEADQIETNTLHANGLSLKEINKEVILIPEVTTGREFEEAESIVEWFEGAKAAQDELQQEMIALEIREELKKENKRKKRLRDHALKKFKVEKAKRVKEKLSQEQKKNMIPICSHVDCHTVLKHASFIKIGRCPHHVPVAEA